jgi:hypothetical protein
VVEPWCAVVAIKGDAVSREDKPGKHDGDRDGQGVYQPDKTETPKDYGRGRHERDESPERDDPEQDD